jgi:hypothetical protein
MLTQLEGMGMVGRLKDTRDRWSRDKVLALFVTAMITFSGVALFSPGTASASGSSNTFTFTGAYTGTLKLKPSSLDCSFGKTYSGKGYLVTLSHMKGTISGAGSGAWAMSAYPFKKGTTHVSAANVNSLTDASFQSNGSPIISFLETSGSITYKGSTGSIDITVKYHAIGSTTYGKVATVTGSWNCGS